MEKLKYFLKTRIFQTFFTLLLLLIFLFFMYTYIQGPLLYADTIILIVYVILFLIPLLLNTLFLVLDYKHIITSKISYRLSLIFMPIFIVYFFIVMFIMACVESYTIVNDYNFYKKINNGRNELVDKMPENIPRDAKNILFHYHVGLSQNDTTMNMYYEIDSLTMKKYIDKYTKYAEQIVKINDDNINDNRYDLFLENVIISENYTIYYLDSRNKEYSYAALNEQEGKCIFVFSYWN